MSSERHMNGLCNETLTILYSMSVCGSTYILQHIQATQAIDKGEIPSIFTIYLHGMNLVQLLCYVHLLISGFIMNLVQMLSYICL